MIDTKAAVHLGDGAYVHYDGFHVVLTANNHNPALATDKVYLEPRALANLMEWLIAIGETTEFRQ